MPTFFAGQTDYIEKLNDVDAAAGAAQNDIDAHIADTTAAHAATAISNTPAGNIAATTVQAAINELDSEKLSASATALPSSFASASINSVTPTGGTLAVTGSISATNSTGRIDANDSRAAGVGVGGSLFLRGKDDNGDYQDFAGINAFLVDGTVGAVGADLIFKTRLSGTLAERMRLLSSGDLLINQTTNPSSYKLAVTGNVGVTGSIGATTNLTLGNGTGIPLAAINGAASGTNGGASLVVQTAGNSLIGLGNKSALLGGAYDATPMLYGNAPIEVNQALNVTGSISATSLVDISAAGAGQIKFPATQNASADANTLDDYEEGGWTVTATSAAGSITSYTATGAYTKVGRMVSVQARVIVTDAGTGTGALVVSLPFVPSAQRSAGSLAEVVLTGKSGRVYVPGADSNAYCVYYDNTSVIATGADFSIQVTYSI